MWFHYNCQPLFEHIVTVTLLYWEVHMLLPCLRQKKERRNQEEKKNKMTCLFLLPTMVIQLTSVQVTYVIPSSVHIITRGIMQFVHAFPHKRKTTYILMSRRAFLSCISLCVFKIHSYWSCTQVACIRELFPPKFYRPRMCVFKNPFPLKSNPSLLDLKYSS